MAMQQPMAGGIASVLGKPPGNPGAQAQPMIPQIGNQPGAPMGIGSVDARAAEFMNNPQGLQKRYGMTQDLYDLLALQKIKTHKEEVARQMQLQMAQQQAQGGQPPTIKDQREQEVHDLTKNELAEQTGDTMKQQYESKQANLQRVAQGGLPPSMAQGIAAAPGAQAAAQPKAMAAGGIVAFAGGGSDTTEQDPDFDADGNPRSQSERADIIAQNERLRLLKSKPLLVGKTQDDRVITNTAGLDRQREFYKPRNPNAVAPMPGAPAQTTPPPAAMPDAATQPSTPPATMPSAPTLDNAGIGGGMRSSIGATRVGPSGGIGSLPDAKNAALRKIQMDQAGIDPKAQQQAEETRVGKLLNTDKETEQRRKYIDEQRAMMQEEFDPERIRQDKLIRFLTAAGGRAYGELGAGANASMDYDAAQRAAKLKRINDIQGKEEGLQALQRKAIEDSIGAGHTIYTGASKLKDAGITAATQSEHADIQSRDNELLRRVEMLKVQAQMAHTAAIKEGNDYAKVQGALDNIIKWREEAANNIYKRYKSQSDMLNMQLSAKPDDPTLKNGRAALDAQIEAEIDKATKSFDQQALDLRTHLYGSGNGGAGVVPGAKVTRIDKPAK